MKKTILTIVILAGFLLTACGGQAAEAPAPASSPTVEPAPPTEVSSNPAASNTETAVPPTEAPTEAPTAEAAASVGVSFVNDIQPIIQSRCVNCHGGSRGTEEGLDMTSYANLLAGSDNGPVVIPGDADGSLLVELVVEQEMPKRGAKLTPPQLQLFIDWVNQGALEN